MGNSQLSFNKFQIENWLHENTIHLLQNGTGNGLKVFDCEAGDPQAFAVLLPAWFSHLKPYVPQLDPATGRRLLRHCPGSSGIWVFRRARSRELSVHLRASGKFQEFFRTHRPPTLAVSGKNDPFFLPAEAEAFRRDNPSAKVVFYDTGHFALETHAAEIEAEIRAFLNSIHRV